MPKTYVSLDLETTGLNADGDAIIEVGALRFQGDQELESFSTFVNPGRGIPPFITELTGITDLDVAGAPPARRVLRDLTTFVGRDTVIGHNVQFDLGFLARHGVLTSNPSIDTFELAGILVPHAGRYSLAHLVDELGIDLPPQNHRALDDARMAMALFNALMGRAAQLPSDMLQEIVRLGEAMRWPAAAFFRDGLQMKARHGFSGGIGAQLAARRGGDAAGPLFLQEELADPLVPRDEPLLLDETQLRGWLAAGGPLARELPGYEPRPQQEEMMAAVAQAFNAGHHLLVEAGTGTGKSMAYLIPSLAWAVSNDQRVVVSTNTINLQEQLVEKDLPALASALPLEFRAALLKGRSHYLCRRQFQLLRQRGPSTDEEIRVLAKILLWLPNTLDGDGDGIFLPTPGERGVWRTISAENELCDPQNCPFYRDEGCFFYRARARAEGAHVLVINHALLLADMASENRVLPEYAMLVIDEAHHLERAATDALRFNVERQQVQFLIETLVVDRPHLPSLVEEVMGVTERLPRKAIDIFREYLGRIEDAAGRTRLQMLEFFDAVAEFLEAHKTGGEDAYAIRLRLTQSLRTQPGWDDVEIAWDQTAPSLHALVDGLNRLSQALEEIAAVDSGDWEIPRLRVSGALRQLGEVESQLHHMIAEPEANGIYWLESERNSGLLTLNSVPLKVGPLIRKQIFDKNRSVIMTSATLRVAGTFDYMRERLEATDADELTVGSPFDYGSSALLYLITDVPEPGQPGHQKAVERTLQSLFQATQGRGMALFTAYSQLQATAQAITGPLSRQQITVYTQGTGSSRAQLLENFRRGNRAVLLGTRSFWEGVDVAGDALSCLAIVKLPFDVPNDPVVAARAETYDDSFNAYMVPEAILRFMQGFGRLIRTRSDRGIVVVLDRRLVTKAYGKRFLDSLPGPAVRKGTAEALSAIAAKWLAGEPLPPVDPEAPRPRVPVFEEPPW